MSDITAATIPVLREDSFDYSWKGDEFPYASDVKVLPGGKHTAEIYHKLEGDGLVHELVQSGKAKFGCELIFKGAFWRETHIDDSDNCELECRQTLTWNAENTSQRILFRPVVVAASEMNAIKLEKKHNVTDLWKGQNITIPKFALLADAGMKGPDVHVQSLLRFRRSKKKFDAFQMDVEREGGEGKTYFAVYVGQSLYELMRSRDRENADLRRAVMISALIGAFSVLQKDHLRSSIHEDAEISSCDILSALRRKLKEHGVVSWDEDPENFSPVNAATKFEKFTWSGTTIMEDFDDG